MTIFNIFFSKDMTYLERGVATASISFRCLEHYIAIRYYSNELNKLQKVTLTDICPYSV